MNEATPIADEQTRIEEHFSIATHNGVITVENTHRSTHRTFRIRTQPQNAKFAPGERILSLMVGPDDYNGIGFVKEDGHVILWKQYRTHCYRRLVDVLQNPEEYRKRGCRYMYHGRCRRCNRELTHPDSIRDGIGPVCAGKQ